MRYVTYRVCQFCGKEFVSDQECKLHEAEEMNLTLAEYETLERLEKTEKCASFSLNGTSNEETRSAHEEASNAVFVFREKHNLDILGNLHHVY